ncbi:Polyprotein [Phytophthora palmivora]|uniref:Polyprotein n=1 Tax=Phytophthora palmivora TaxID=4796 RepID=A0A2P4XYF9_9STRA|nr:Polyprotein [Phytophthora palmivora]
MANRRLARWHDLQPDTKFFHDLSITSFNNTSFSLAISDVVMSSDIISKIKKTYKKDREFQSVADDNPRIAVPNDVKIRQQIIGECHDAKYGGHTEAARTYLTLVHHWYWSKMLKSIQKLITDCEPCRRNKPRLEKLQACSNH